MIIYGKNQVYEYLKAGGRVKKIFVYKNAKIPEYLQKLLNTHKYPVVLTDRSTLQRIAGTDHARDIVIIAPEFQYTPIDKIIEKASLLLYLDHVKDPVNLGSIIRTATAFKVDGLLLPERRSAKITSTVIRVSEGYVFKLPVALIPNPLNFLKRLKDQGFFLYALERGGISIEEIEFTRPMVLIVGSEGEGVSKKLLQLADFVISIPQEKTVNSLNVHIATAIGLYKIYISTVNKIK